MSPGALHNTTHENRNKLKWTSASIGWATGPQGLSKKEVQSEGLIWFCNSANGDDNGLRAVS